LFLSFITELDRLIIFTIKLEGVSRLFVGVLMILPLEDSIQVLERCDPQIILVFIHYLPYFGLYPWTQSLHVPKCFFLEYFSLFGWLFLLYTWLYFGKQRCVLQLLGLLWLKFETFILLRDQFYIDILKSYLSFIISRLFIRECMVVSPFVKHRNLRGTKGMSMLLNSSFA